MRRRRRSQRAPYLSEAAIARSAGQLVRAYQAKQPDYALPYDLEELIWEHLNVVDELSLDDETPLGCDPDTGDSVLGKTVLEERVILIDPSVKAMPFYRFTLAHEIGHWVLHCRPLLRLRTFTERIAAKKEDQQARRTVFTTMRRSLEPQGRDRREIQANLFASALLMPAAEVRRAFEERHGGPITWSRAASDYRSLGACAEALASESMLDLPPLHRHFDVSISTMAVRLQALRLIVPAGSS